MAILLAFTPFFVYVVLSRLANIPLALLAAALTSAALLVRDAVSRGRSVKVLEVGTLLLFGGLAAYAFLVKVAWTIPAVRLRVDLGLMLIVLVSIAIRKPFTLQYAREQTPPEVWSTQGFLRTEHNIISAVWAAAFAVLVAVDLAMIYVPSISTRLAIIVTILALYAAARFTAWYPERNAPRPVVQG